MDKSSPSKNNNSSDNRLLSSVMENYPYPECWNDEERMRELYLPFRDCSVNPENYHGKMKFWQNTIAIYCEHKCEPFFSIHELKMAFDHKFGAPRCLDLVIQEMLRTKQIRLLSEYEEDPLNSWATYIKNIIRGPITFFLHAISNALGFVKDTENTLYIHIGIMKRFCNSNEIHLRKFQGKILYFEELKEILTTTVKLSPEFLNPWLLTLHCERKVGLDFEQIGNQRKIYLVKIPNGMNSDVNITETDRAIHRMQMLQKNLGLQLERFEKNINEYDIKIRKLLKENNRKLAKTILRKKHNLEKSYENRCNALQNVEKLLNSIEDVITSGDMVDVLKIGNTALNNILEKNGLNANAVDEIMADIQQNVRKQQDIQDILADTSIIDETYDSVMNSDEIEREFNDILNESKTNEEAKKETPATSKEAPKISIEVTDKITDAELIQMLENLEVQNKSGKECEVQVDI